MISFIWFAITIYSCTHSRCACPLTIHIRRTMGFYSLGSCFIDAPFHVLRVTHNLRCTFIVLVPRAPPIFFKIGNQFLWNNRVYTHSYSCFPDGYNFLLILLAVLRPFGCGYWKRTSDLRLMRPSLYHWANPQYNKTRF